MNYKHKTSFTSYKKWMFCPASFDNEYNKGLVSAVSPGFFIHGSAIDKGVNSLLEGKSFLSAVRSAFAELERLYMENVEFDERDYDGELIRNKSRLLRMLKIAGYPGDSVDGLADRLMKAAATNSPMSAKEHQCYLVLMNASMRAKTLIMLRDFVRKVMPRIKRVVSVQKKVERGFLDCEVELDGTDGIVTADTKTAYRRYDSDAVVTSVQLAGYKAQVGAYFVLNKMMTKNRIKTCSVCGHVGKGTHKTCDYTDKDGRCGGDWEMTIHPECDIQILVDPVPESMRQAVEESYSAVDRAIELGVFPKNLNACIQQFGKKRVPCPYYQYCRTGSLDGLKKRERRS
jgi:hypothetical protein